MPTRLLLTTILLLATSAALSAQTTYTVTTTADAGPGSLRQAILDANASAGADVIAFAIPGAGPHTIQPQSALPEITDAVTIDGLTQPGADCSAWPATLLVEIDGSAVTEDRTSGLLVTADNAIVRGLVMNRFDTFGASGMDWQGSGGTLVCNYVGTDPSGTVALPNGDGVRMRGADNTVGVPGFPGRNLLSGNIGEGLDLSGEGHVVQGNYLGPDVAGFELVAADFRQQSRGLSVEGSGHLIGGPASSAGNVISGNLSSGIEIEGEDIVVQGNLIGLDPESVAELPNGLYGLVLFRSARVTVGGPEEGARNVIAGNGLYGIYALGASDNVIQGNYIGTDAAGVRAFPNGEDGILVQGFTEDPSDNNVIGGPEPGAGNLISGNGDDGISLLGPRADGTLIQNNTIGLDATGAASLANRDEGIDLEAIEGARILGNVIAGNDGNGIVADDIENVEVFGNRLGTDAGGTRRLGNGQGGVVLRGNSEGVTIGGTGRDEANVVAFNGTLGVDLGGDGVTPNDAGDADEGPNRLQNHPDPASATGDGTATLTVRYTVDTAPANAAYPLTVAFFLADADGEEGQVFLGTDTYAEADAQAEREVAFTPAQIVPTGARLVATATDADGNTSEFSASVAITGSVASEDTASPAALALDLAGPNPFRRATTLALTMPTADPARVTVHDVLGRQVAVLHDGPLAAGAHAFGLRAERWPAGVYAVRAEVAGSVAVRAVTLMR